MARRATLKRVAAAALAAAAAQALLLAPAAGAAWARDETLVSISYVVEGDIAKLAGPARCALSSEDPRASFPIDGLHNEHLVQFTGADTVMPDSPFVLYVDWRKARRAGYHFQELLAGLRTGAGAVVPKLIVIGGKRDFGGPAAHQGWHIPTPICVVYTDDNDIIASIEPGATHMRISVQNGEVERVYIGTDDATRHMAVYADGELLKHELLLNKGKPPMLVRETYQVLSFTLDAGAKWAYVAATDGFGTGTMWRCASFQAVQDMADKWMFADGTADVLKHSGWRPILLFGDPVPITVPDGLVLNANRLDLSDFAGKTVCRGIRSEAEIMHRVKAYQIVYEARAWEAARVDCEQRGMQLASIHSIRDNRFVSSLLAAKRAGSGKELPRAWVGNKDGFWIDQSTADFWAVADDGYIERDIYDTERAEYMILNSSRAPGSSWSFSDSTREQLPYVCQRFADVGGELFDDGQLCMWYMTGDQETERHAHTPPKLRSGRPGLCSLGTSPLSCCTDTYVDRVVRNRIELVDKLLETWIDPKLRAESKPCIELLEQFVCFDCQANQGDFLSFIDELFRLRVCSDTYSLIESACTSVARPDVEVGDFAKFTRVLSRQLYGHSNMVIDRDVDHCFRFVGSEPLSIVNAYPEDELYPHLDVISMTFSRSLRPTSSVMLDISPTPLQRGGQDHILVFDNDLFPGGVSFDSVLHPNDTIVLALDKEVSNVSLCALAEGKYSVSANPSSIHDMAGNRFVRPYRWTLVVTSECHVADYSLVWFIVACVGLTCFVFAAMCFRHARMLRLKASDLDPLQPDNEFSPGEYNRMIDNEDADEDSNTEAQDLGSGEKPKLGTSALGSAIDGPLLEGPRLPSRGGHAAGHALEMQELNHV